MTAILFALIGASIGSFTYASAIRVGRSESIAVTGDYMPARSHCDTCGHLLHARDLIPLLSFIILRGRCRYCHTRIHWHSFVTEAVCFLFAFIIVDMQFSVAQIVVLLCYLAILSFTFWYDWLYLQILDYVMFPSILIAALCSVVFFERTPQECVIGAAIVGGFFLFQYLVSRGRWIGDGDIRLGVLMGVMLGPQAAIVALCMAYMIGAICAVILIIQKKASLGMRIPFGTFLSLATLIALPYGNAIWVWYMHLINYSV